MISALGLKQIETSVYGKYNGLNNELNKKVNKTLAMSRVRWRPIN